MSLAAPHPGTCFCAKSPLSLLVPQRFNRVEADALNAGHTPKNTPVPTDTRKPANTAQHGRETKGLCSELTSGKHGVPAKPPVDGGGTVQRRALSLTKKLVLTKTVRVLRTGTRESP